MSSLVPNMIVRPQTSRTEITEKMNTFETNVLPVTAADGQLVGFATLYGAQKTDIAQEATHHLTRARLELYLSALPK